MSNNSISQDIYINIKQTHKYMLNTFISLLILGFIHLPLNTYSLLIYDSTCSIMYYRRIYIMIINIILIGLYGLGLCVLHRHSRIGLLTFAWLVAILDILATLTVLSLLFIIIFLMTPISVYSVEIFTGLFLFIILSIIGFIYMTISIQHALHLSKLFKNNRQLITEI
ncbi:hypothetical protein I4U23_011935 [Adineta vaga]|nr:hypothetical protein I4U23_011935 [Adineta vaga]